MAIGRFAIASERNATAVGPGAVASDQLASAFGYNAVASGYQSTAFSTATASGIYSLAMSLGAQATNRASVAIGMHAHSTGLYSVALGGGETAGNTIASGTHSVVVGYGARASTDSAMAFGTTSRAEGVSSVAIGGGRGQFGTGARATADDAIAIGAASQASGQNSVAIGGADTTANGAKASEARATALGFGSTASAADAIAIGDATAGAADAIAMGRTAQATGVMSIAIGYDAIATGSIAMGASSRAGNGGAAFGDGANATYNGGVIDPAIVAGAALGQNAIADVSGATALGTNSSVTAINGVALGSGSVANTAAGAAGYDPLTGAPSTDTSATWVSTLGAVSVGSAGNTRQITNVAAGTEDTDAVNVAQLKAGQTHYYSVNDNGSKQDNYDNTGAQGANSVAAGPGASTAATAAGSVALGYNATTGKYGSGQWGVAIGESAAAYGVQAIGIGYQAGMIDPASVNPNDSSLVAIGTGAGYLAKSGSDGAGVSSAVFLGANAGSYSQGYRNNFLGANAGANSGSAITFSEVLPALPANVITGAPRGGNVNDAGHNLGLGDEAFTNALGNWNTAVGTASLSGANGQRNTAQGFYSGFKTTGDDNVAVGYMAGVIPGANAAAAPTTVNANRTISVGRNALANADDAVALGYLASATEESGVALGANSVANTAAGAVGYDPLTGAPSTDTSATWVSTLGAVSVGSAGNTRQITNVAAGTEDTDAVNVAQLKAGQTHYYSVNDNGVVGGNYNNDGATGTNALAAGVDATATKAGAAALGYSATADGLESVAIGTKAYAGGIGSGSTASTAIGALSEASGVASTAIGSGAKATNLDSVAIGSRAESSGIASVAVGDGSSALATNANAFGNQSAANAKNSVALGSWTQANVQGGVALGYASHADTAGGVAGYDPTTGLASTDTTGVWRSTDGAVSVGGQSAFEGRLITRQITNVAAGTEDTDAVNVAQLKAVSAAAVAAETHYYSVNDGGTKGGNYANDGATGKNSLAAGINATAVGTETVAIGVGAQASGRGQVSVGENASANSTGRNGTSVGSEAGTDVTGDNNVALGRRAGRFVVGNDNVSAGIGAGGVVTGDRNVSFGRNAGRDVIGSDNIAMGFNAGSGISASNTVAIGVNAKATTSQAIALGSNSSVSVADGVALGAGSVASVAGGALGYNPAGVGAAQIAAIQATNSSTLGAVSVGTGAAGGNRQVVNVAAGTNDSDAVNVSQLKAVQSVAGAGWDVTDGSGNKANIGPGGTVTFESSNTNIAVSQTGADDDGVVDITLSDTLDLGATGSVTMGQTIINNAGVVVGPNVTLGNTGLIITGGPSVTTTGINAGGTVITNVAPGVNGTDAVNVDQLEAVVGTVGAGWNLSAQGTNQSKVSPGSAVDLNNTDGNIVITKPAAASDVTFNLADDVVVNNSVAVGTVLINAPTNDITGLSNTTLTDPTFATVGRGATEEQLSLVRDEIGTQIDANKTKYYSVNSIGGGNEANDGATGTDAIASGKDAEAEGDEAVAMGLGATAVGNGSVALGSGAQALSLNSLAFGVGAMASHANSIAMGAGSATTVGAQASYNGAYVGNSSSTGEMNVGGRQITGVAAGSAATDAVNVSQLQGGVNYAISESKAYTDTQISNVNTAITNLDNRVTNIEGDIIDIQGDITNIQGDIVDIQGDITNLTTTLNEFDNRVTNVANGADGMFQVSQEGPIVKPQPTGTNSSAGGNGASAGGNNALAVGNQSKASGDNSTAIGTGANASAANSTAIGQGATASHANSVALGQGSATTVGAQTNYKAAYVGSSNSTGEVNMGGRTLTGIAPGIAGTDAVNVNQLNAGVNHAINVANQYTDGQIGSVRSDMWQMQRDFRGATSSAMAMAGLPQAYLPGKSMLAVGFGGYQGEYGMAFGLSGITENGRYVYKAQASGNTSRDWGFSIGAGLQW